MERSRPQAVPSLLEPVELVALLKVPEPTLREWRYRGKGPKWIIVGRHVRYRWSDVEAWLDAQSRGPEVA